MSRAMERLAREAVAKELERARDRAPRARGGAGARSAPRAEGEKTANTRDLEERLTRTLGTRVTSPTARARATSASRSRATTSSTACSRSAVGVSEQDPSPSLACGRLLPRTAWQRRSSTARRSPSGCAPRSRRARAAFEKRTGRKPGLEVVLVGDDPASQVYVRNKERASIEVGHARRRAPLAGRQLAGERGRARAAAQRRPDGRRHPGAAAAAQADRPRRGDRVHRRRPRTSTVSRRSTPACSRSAAAGCARARRSAACGCSTRPASSSRASARSWSAAATSSASRSRSCCSRATPR